MELNAIASQVVSIAVSAVCGWLLAQMSSIHKRDEAIFAGMKAVLRREIVDAYQEYVVNAEPLSIERKQEVGDCYAAYAELGGNGLGEQLYKEFCEVPVIVLSSGK